MSSLDFYLLVHLPGTRSLDRIQPEASPESNPTASRSVTRKVNGRPRTLLVAPRTLLVQALRDDLGLTGTKIGCDTSRCGACTVHLDGNAVKSCSLLALQAEGAEVTTIEGVGDPEDLHVVQRAFAEEHGFQCGFCTPGMVMSVIDLLEQNRGSELSDAEIRQALQGNLCRCTGYENIVRSVRRAQQLAER